MKIFKVGQVGKNKLPTFVQITKKASIANASLVQNDVREMVDLPKIDDSNQNTN